MKDFNQTMSRPFVSVIVVTYNSRDDIEQCLRSVADQDYPNFEIIVVDNNSEDDTVALVRGAFPSVVIVENNANCGFAAGNNRGIAASGGTYVAVLNPDTIVERAWLAELVRPLEERADVAACQSRLLFYDRPDVINAEGNDVNYLGFTWCRNYGNRSDGATEIQPTPALSGCSTILRRDVLDQLGLFDEDFFMYLEDTDLSLRIRRAGYQIVCNPKSVVYHKYKFDRGKKKFYYLEKNRMMLLLKNYDRAKLLRIMPAFMFMEIGILALSIFRGWFKQKILSYAWILRNFRAILSKRAAIQRRGNLENMFDMMSPTITFEEIQNPLLARVVNPVLGAYYRLMICRGSKGPVST